MLHPLADMDKRKFKKKKADQIFKDLHKDYSETVSRIFLFWSLVILNF